MDEIPALIWSCAHLFTWRQHPITLVELMRLPFRIGTALPSNPDDGKSKLANLLIFLYIKAVLQ